jgi:transposase
MAAPKKYPDELRERAVRLWRDTQRPIAHVAREQGVHPEALRNWIRQDEADRGERDDRLSTVERDELKRLRAENTELRRANEVLLEASMLRQGTRLSPDEVSPVVEVMRGRFGVEAVCRVVGVPTSTYYARRSRPPSARVRSDQADTR